MAGLIVIAGPTGSGKSVLALRLAERLGGVIVNADSMQLYRELRLLTARPGAADEARVPHRLYGSLEARDPGSVGRWLTQAEAAIAEAATGGAWAVVVGGTGLYLGALLRGLARLPDIPEDLRASLRRSSVDVPTAALHQRLAALDGVMAQRLRPSDRQRILRALEVRIACGVSLAELQAMPPGRPALPRPRLGLALDPPRAALAARIERRLRAMIEAGALVELEALRRQGLDPSVPLLRAVAVPELLAHLEGRVDLDRALERAAARTRQYAKRQRTWLRHQLPELPRVAAFGEELAARAAKGEPLAALGLAPIAGDAPELPG